MSFGAPLPSQHRVVVDVLVIARGDGGGHDQRAGQGDGQLGQGVATDTSSKRAGGRPVSLRGAGIPAHAGTSRPSSSASASWLPSRAS